MSSNLSMIGARTKEVGLAVIEARDFVSSSKELAFCVARSFVVNNPRAAKECFRAAGDVAAPDFEVKLYNAFVAKGRWPTRIKHAREAVERLGLWEGDAVDVLRSHLR
jgi:hypothetical protein